MWLDRIQPESVRDESLSPEGCRNSPMRDRIGKDGTIICGRRIELTTEVVAMMGGVDVGGVGLP